jgi:hypothetical protein
MSISISKDANVNYLAKVVKLNNIRKHSNADRLQCVSIDGNNVITGTLASEGGLYVYFPLESAINSNYLSWSNSYEKKELNQDTEAKGFFGHSGRVRAIRLRGERSEGYIVPANDISSWVYETTGNDFVFTEEHAETEFDTINGLKLCEKYVNIVQLKKLKENKKNNNTKKVAKVSKLIDNQFRFHIDTAPLRKNVRNINPNDYISITNKLHGTSFVVSNVLCKKKLTFVEKVLKKLGVNIVDSHYDLVYSSRKVVKNKNIDDDNKNHFYGYDLWGDIAQNLKGCLTEGISLYGEAVGYTKTGAYIQNQYDYGCDPGKFETYIYRITLTNASGKVFEFSSQQIKDYCNKFGINHVPEFYYGKAKDLFDLPLGEHWNVSFMEKLSDEYLEKDCDICVNKVPAEGIVLRREVSDIDVYKHKSFRFFEHETKQLDSGEIDLETQESIEEE